jgi:hypothetical protein
MTRLPQGCRMSRYELLDRITQIFQQVPAVCHMDGLRCAGPTATRIGFPTIAADNLDARMCLEPRTKGFLCALGQQVYRSMLLQIDQDRTHVLTTAKGPIIDAQDPWCRVGWWNMATQQGKYGVRTDRHTLTGIVARSSFPTKRKTGSKQMIT